MHRALLAATDLPMRGPDSPPIPLILGGWWASSASNKHQRWQETIRWAEARGLSHITSEVADDRLVRWDSDLPPWDPSDDASEPG